MGRVMKKNLLAALLLCVTYNAFSQEGRPVLTTGGVVHVCPSNKIALIERGKAPFGYAMFGGHVENESPKAAFIREAEEELSINDITQMSLIGVNGEPGRDPRQYSVEITYTCVTNQNPVASSDAKKVHLLGIKELQTILNEKQFAFNHAEILKKYLADLGDCNPCEQACGVGIAVE